MQEFQLVSISALLNRDKTTIAASCALKHRNESAAISPYSTGNILPGGGGGGVVGR